MKLKSGKRVTLIPDYSGLSDASKELWREWIWALRTGGFPQTDGFLQSNEGFCVFGVVTEINKERLKGRWLLSDRVFGGIRFYVFRMEGQSILDEASGSLPQLLGEQLGFSKNDRYVGFSIRLEGVFRSVTLSNLNDNFHARFQEIAMLLELALNGGYDVDRSNRSIDGRG
jgi:hypothetical protein